jgi:predicted nuclease with TOPRIM domain
MKNREPRLRILCLLLFVGSGALLSFAGVSRPIQEQYKKTYENKAMVLKIPIYAEKQMIYISGQSFRVEQGSGTPRYKVGDQLRVIAVEFGGEEIRFRLGNIAAPGYVDLGFRFDGSLQENFPNKDVFDRALRSALTEGLKYTEIDEAKESFVKEQFERSLREIAGSASISREAVLKNIAPYIPAYLDARQDIENLRNRVQDISSQLSQSQSESRKLESDSKAQQTELARLKTANAGLQEKLDNYNSQLSKLGDEVRDAKGSAQGYQKELANIQRSLNIRVDSGRDLAAQITDLGQAMKKLQKDNASLAGQISSLRTNLDAQQAANTRLVGENEDLKSRNHNLQSTLTVLTSNQNSLGRQYLDLKNAKEKLDDFAQSIHALRTQVIDESTSDGTYYCKANVYLKNVLIGSLNWSIPAYLNHGESKSGEASVTTESINYVQVTPDERHILRTLGEKFKIRIDLTSASNSMTVTPDQAKTVHEVGERDHTAWKWTISNQGTKDARLTLTACLINKDSHEIGLIQREHAVAASNVVRQIRGYLQPIPLVVGILLGFLLFGIVGIFRKPKARADLKASSQATPGYADKKEL